MNRIFYILISCIIFSLPVFAKSNATCKPDLGKDRSLCGGSIDLSPVNAQNYTYFYWSRLVTPISPAPPITVGYITINTPGTYILSTTDKFGCSAADTVIITQTLPVPDYAVKAYATLSIGYTEITSDSVCNAIQATLLPSLPDTLHSKYKFSWNVADKDSAARLKVNSSYNYQLTVTSKATGCTLTKNKVYRVVAMPQICMNVTKDNGLTSLGYDSLKVVTIAGKAGVTGSANGIGTAATFNEPWDVVFYKGNLYVTDKLNNKIRKITLNNYTVSDFAGTGSSVVTDNVAINLANFNGPTGLTFDRKGNAYVANETGNFISKVDITTNKVFAIGGTPNTAAGYADGKLYAAKFSAPKEIFSDSLSNIFVADYGNHAIRKISPDGNVSTIGGGMPPTASSGYVNGLVGLSRFNAPFGLTLDRSGNIYVSEIGNQDIRKIDLKYSTVKVAGVTGTSGANSSVIGTSVLGSSATFNKPSNLVVTGASNLFISDVTNNIFRNLTPQGNVITKLGKQGISSNIDGGKLLATFGTPAGMTMDNNNNVYIVDRTQHVVRKISRNKSVILCLSDTSTAKIDANCSNQTSPEYSWSWTKNGVYYSNLNSIPVLKRDTVYAKPDVYVLTVSKNVGLTSTYNCVETVSDTVFVYFRRPPKGIAITTSRGNTTVCTNDSVTLYAPKKFKNYIWTIQKPLNIGGVIVAQGPKQDSIRVGAPSGTSMFYYVVVQDTVPQGCQYQASINLVKLALPIVDINADTTICAGYAMKLRTSNTYSTSWLYTWSPNTNMTLDPYVLGKPVSVTVTPTSTIKYKLKVVNNISKCSNTDSITITVNPQPQVLAGNDTAICAGGSVFLNAKNTAPGTLPYTYTWSTVPSGSSLIGQNQVINNPTLGRTWQIRILDAKGCSDRDTIKYVVNSIPVPTVLVSDVTVCPQSNVSLGAYATGGLGPYIFNWTPNTALSPNNTVWNPSASPLSTTRYVAKVTDQNGCFDTVSTIVRTTGFAIKNFGPKPTAIVCQGNSIQLNATASILGTDPAPVISWNQTTPLLSNNAIINPIAYPTNTTTPTKYVMTVKDKSNCILKDSVLITVSTSPTIVASPDTAICQGSAAYLTIKNVTGGTAPYTYTWVAPTGGGMANTNGIPQIVTPTVTGALEYQVSVKDAGNCVGNTAKVNVIVNETPLVDLGLDTLACGGSTVVLNANRQQVTGPLSYTWTGGAVGAANYLRNVTSDGTYSVIVTNNVTYCSSVEDFRLVTFKVPLSPIQITVPAQVCKSNDIQFTSNLVSGTQPIKYTWTVFDGTTQIAQEVHDVINSYQDNLTFASTATSPNTISVTVEADNGCPVVSDSKSFTYFDSPSVKISGVDPNPANLGMPVIISQNSVFDKTLTWNFGDGSPSVVDGNSKLGHVYTSAGTFKVSLFAENLNGCTAIDTLNLSVNNLFDVWVPNILSPSATNDNNSHFRVYGNGIANGGFQMSIYNRWGNVIYTADSYDKALSGWNGKLNNDGEDLPLGVYTYVIKGSFTNGQDFKKTGSVTLVR